MGTEQGRRPEVVRARAMVVQTVVTIGGAGGVEAHKGAVG